MKYKIAYEYSWYTLGCDCCTQSVSTIQVYDENRIMLDLEDVEYMENAEELITYMREAYPEYADAEVDEANCIWF